MKTAFIKNVGVYTFSVFMIILFSFLKIGSGAEENVFLVAVESWPPFKIKDEKGWSGIDIDILRAVEKKLGVRFEFVECPWIRCIDMIKRGEIDIITSFSRTPERMAFVDYPDAGYSTGDLAFYTAKNTSVPIRNYEDLNGLNIGVILGSVYFDRFDSDESLKKISLNKSIQLFKMLEVNRLDTFIGYEQAVNYKLISAGFADKFIKHPCTFCEKHEDYIAVSKKIKQKDFLKKLNSVLTQMKENNEFQKITDAFFFQYKELQTSPPDSGNKDTE